MHIIIERLSKKSWETPFLFQGACFLLNFGLVIPYFVRSHAVFMGYIPQPSYKAMTFYMLAALLLRLRRQPLLLLGNIFNE